MPTCQERVCGSSWGHAQGAACCCWRRGQMGVSHGACPQRAALTAMRRPCRPLPPLPQEGRRAKRHQQPDLHCCCTSCCAYSATRCSSSSSCFSSCAPRRLLAASAPRGLESGWCSGCCPPASSRFSSPGSASPGKGGRGAPPGALVLAASALEGSLQARGRGWAGCRCGVADCRPCRDQSQQRHSLLRRPLLALAGLAFQILFELAVLGGLQLLQQPDADLQASSPRS